MIGGDEFPRSEYGEIENVYDEEEIYVNCTVQVWRNSKTGKVSIGWWPNTEEGEQG